MKKERNNMEEQQVTPDEQPRIDPGLKQKLSRLGNWLFPLGIVALLAGSSLQVFIYLASGGTEMTKQPRLLVWGGILAAIGIVMLVAGFAMRIIGSYKQEE